MYANIINTHGRKYTFPWNFYAQGSNFFSAISFGRTVWIGKNSFEQKESVRFFTFQSIGGKKYIEFCYSLSCRISLLVKSVSWCWWRRQRRQTPVGSDSVFSYFLPPSRGIKSASNAFNTKLSYLIKFPAPNCLILHKHKKRAGSFTTYIKNVDVMIGLTDCLNNFWITNRLIATMEIPVRVSGKANFILMDGNGYENCVCFTAYARKWLRSKEKVTKKTNEE